MQLRSLSRLLCIFALSVAVTGCVSIGEANRAMLAMDADWAPENDLLFRGDGRRTYRVPQAAALAAIESTMHQYRMTIRRRDSATGSIVGDALAPRPLSEAEWKEVTEIETPRMRDIVRREIGPLSSAMFSLEPKSYVLIFAVAVTSNRDETSIGVTAKMRNINPIPGVIYPENMPPEAARRGVSKLWATFEDELRTAGFNPERGTGSPTRPAEPARAL